jgi:hypothetical protein
MSGDYDKIESFFDTLQMELKSMEILEYQLGTIPELEVALTEVFSSVLGLCGICVEYIRKKRIGTYAIPLLSYATGDATELCGTSPLITFQARLFKPLHRAQT